MNIVYFQGGTSNSVHVNYFLNNFYVNCQIATEFQEIIGSWWLLCLPTMNCLSLKLRFKFGCYLITGLHTKSLISVGCSYTYVPYVIEVVQFLFISKIVRPIAKYLWAPWETSNYLLQWLFSRFSNPSIDFEKSEFRFRDYSSIHLPNRPFKVVFLMSIQVRYIL